jgi:RHS repeat-associated protein
MLSKNYENGYRYGFNGQEKDDEVYGNGNSYTAEFWQYDPRLGRRWNNDPMSFTWQSTYTTFNNNPIIFVDPLGLFGTRKEARQYKKEHKIKGKISKGSDGIFSINDRKGGFSYYRDESAIMKNGINIGLQDDGEWKSVIVGNNKAMSLDNNMYSIENADLKDRNIGQYAVNDKPGVIANVPFTTYITPTVNGNNVRISGRVDYYNSMGDPIYFSSVAYLYGNDGELIESKNLGTKLDYSNGKQYFLPQGWTGSATFKLIDANDIKAHNYSVIVKTSGVVKTDAGRAILTKPGSLFTITNYGVNSFDIKLKKK